MSIVELKTRKTEVVESVVDRLEEILAKAKSGDVVSVAIATVHLDRSVGCSWSETDEFGMLLGSVARLQYRINEEQDPKA